MKLKCPWVIRQTSKLVETCDLDAYYYIKEMVLCKGHSKELFFQLAHPPVMVQIPDDHMEQEYPEDHQGGWGTNPNTGDELNLNSQQKC